MPQDFDIDKFMAERRKAAAQPPGGQQQVSTGPSFDVDSFMRERRQPQRPQPRNLAPTERQEFNVRRPASLDESLNQSARMNRAPQPKIAPESKFGPLYESVQEQNRRGRAREAFEKKPMAEQWYERGKDALNRGLTPIMNAMTVAPSIPNLLHSRQARATGDKALAEWQAERSAGLAERQASRPSSLGTEIGEGIVEAIPSAGVAALTGGTGILGAALTGGGLAAANIPAEQWRQAPGRSALQTGIGAAAPILGGQAGQRIGGAVASRLARPAAQGLARAGGEVLGGAAGNVTATGAEQLAFEGKLNPRELAKSGVIGGALSAPGAVGAARRPISTQIRPNPRTPEGAIIAPESPIAGRRLLPPARGEEIIPTEPLSRAVREIVTQPDPRFVPKPAQASPRAQVLPAIQPVTAGAEPSPPQPQPQGRAVRVGDKDYTLTPEQEARWIKQVDQPLNQAKLRAADLAQGQGRQEADKYRKGVAMRVAAKKREIVGAFTEREQAARAAREATNYRGKAVSVEGVNGTVEGQSFGRVRVKLEDGRELTVLASQVAPPTPPPRTPEGAIIAQPSSLPSRKLLPPGSVTPETQRLQYPDAPETQQMPAIRERIAAENAPTRELPALTMQPERLQTAANVRRPSQADIPPNERQPAETEVRPEAAVDERIQTTPPAGQTRSPIDRPRTERLAVPKATPETIDSLRSRQEELGRLAYDRRGDFTGDLRDEYNQITAHIRDYENARAPREIGEPPGMRPERGPLPEERQARRAALQAKEPEMPETLTPGRKVTQEVQIPGLKASETFISREDARQGHFERFSDQELVDEIRRMEDVRNQDIRGRSRLTPEQLEANRFDLKIAVDQQKERRRLQQQIGIEPGERIAPRTPTRFKRTEAALETPPSVETGRQIQHSKFGAVTESPNQKGVPRGKLRVIDSEGVERTIQNPRTRGNREASFVKSTGPVAQPAAPMESRGKPPDIVRSVARLARTPSSPVEITKLREQFPGMSRADFDAAMIKANEEGGISLHRHDYPQSLKEAERNNLVKIGNDYYSAATLREGKGHVMGFGLGFLGNMRRPSRAEVSRTAGGVQALSQLGNPKFVIRNVLQHVGYGKQERIATRVAAAMDWVYSGVTGKGRQITAPRGSDLVNYVRNMQKAVQAYKSGQPLPGKRSPIQHTANANKVDKAVQKVMTWLNEIPDAANWQTRFEDSLKSIVEAGKRSGKPFAQQDAIDQAMLEANKASLRDKNFASDALKHLKKFFNKASKPITGTDKFGLGDFVAKYTQIPGALLKRGLERSPLGLFEVAKQAATPGQFRRRNTLLALSRVAEGAATGVGLGAGLAAAGVLVGPEEENKTGKGFEREEGVRGYSLNASALRRMLTGDFGGEMQDGDTLYSIDWLQPWAMNLSAGAALWGLHKNGKLGGVSGAKASGEAVYNSLAKTLDIMGDQSVIKNLSRYVRQAGTGETPSQVVYQFMRAIGLDVPSSFVPSLARQTRQVIDPYERDTRPEQRGGIGGFAREATSRALSQIPGVSESFPRRPSLLTGEDRKTALGEFSTSARIAAQFSPANVSTYTPRPVAQEISRLNRAGEKVSISFPAPKTDKKTGAREATSDLRIRERRFAETFSRMSQELIQDSFYKDADNETKAAAWAGLKRHLANLGKEDFEEKSVDEIVESAMETVEKRRDKEEK